MFEFKVAFFTLFGIIFGSFLNVVIFRIPNEVPISKGRSFCPVCKNQIKWYDNIPILSYLILCGKCRNCKTKISWVYPVVEALTGVCFFLIIWFIPDFHRACFLAVITCSLISLGFIDFFTMEIPNRFIVMNFVVSCFFFMFNDIIWWERLIGLLSVSVPFLLIMLATRGGMGGGDVKLMFSVGLMLGWKLSLLSAGIGFVLGAIVGITLLARKQATGKTELAFGPYLSIGIFVCAVFGNQLLALFGWL